VSRDDPQTLMLDRSLSVRAEPGVPVPSRYRAAIVGLGHMGSRCDDHPCEDELSSHAGAYQALPDVELVSGADPDSARLRRFQERRGIALGYRDYREMLACERIQLLSVCSPTPLHHEMVMAAVRAGVRAIFCEKPLASTMAEAVDMVEACEASGVILAVNHTRRWDPIYQRARRLLAGGVIGRVQAIAGAYPGKVFTLGTHLFDLMRFFGGNVEWVCGDSVGYEDGEWSFSGLLRFESGIRGTVICGQTTRNYIFELDVLGTDGRLRVTDDGVRIDIARYVSSSRFAGFRELLPSASITRSALNDETRLVAAIRDIVSCARYGGAPAGSGRDGMAALAIAWGLCESTALGSVRVDIRR
jgi:predicted dehydrogenase